MNGAEHGGRIVDRIAGHIAAALDAVAERLWPERDRNHSRERVRLGRAGERMAARVLRRRGYRILARNFRAAGGEIDLVAMDGATLVFIEVKTRTGEGAGAPAEAVDRRKQQRLRRAAAAFAASRRAMESPMRFDVVAITTTGRARKLELIRDAF
jgi:putative endonuclease